MSRVPAADPLLGFVLDFCKTYDLLEDPPDRLTVPLVGRLAARQGITQLDAVVDVVPLCFEHTAYKSYPSRLLQDGHFDQLTRWLNKLTPHDLTKVDAAGVDSIDEWRRKQPIPTPSRSEAIRQLVRLGLKVKAKP